jgi:hypothetical protein
MQYEYIEIADYVVLVNTDWIEDEIDIEDTENE